ncbi:MAG: alpha/beta fold hydrolase [Myxococcota bacterium]
MELRDPDALVTGATGLIGRNLLVSLTARGRTVAALVRNAAARAEMLAEHVERHGGDPSRLKVIEGDLDQEGLGLAPALDGVRDVFHCAGRFAFGLSPDEAAAANVEGSLRVVRWAHARPALRRLVYVGGYRMTALPSWVGTERPRGPLRRRLYRHFGAYEASKIEAGLAVDELAAELSLPLTRIHPATVIGPSTTGHSEQTIGLAETMGRLWRGQLPALVGNERTFVPVVTADYLADFMATAVEREATEGQSLVVFDPDTPRLPRLLREAAEHLGVRAPRVCLPVGAVRALPRALTGVEPETLSFLAEDDYDTRTAQAHADAVGLVHPPLRQAMGRWLDHLVSTRFGEQPQASRGRLCSVAGSRTFAVGDPGQAKALLLHGLPWDGECFRGLEQQLPDSVARVDLPGLGRSSLASGGAEGQGAWLDALLERRRSPLVIVAHSLACEIALRWAQDNPQRVESLVLVSPYFMQRPAPLFMRIPALVSMAMRGMKAEDLRRRLVPEAPTDDIGVERALASAAAQLARPGVARQVGRSLARVSASGHRAEMNEILRNISARVPVQIIHGERDPLIEVVPQLHVQCVPGAGHDLHVSRPEVIAPLLARETERGAPRSASVSRSCA